MVSAWLEPPNVRSAVPPAGAQLALPASSCTNGHNAREAHAPVTLYARKDGGPRGTESRRPDGANLGSKQPTLPAIH